MSGKKKHFMYDSPNWVDHLEKLVATFSGSKILGHVALHGITIFFLSLLSKCGTALNDSHGKFLSRLIYSVKVRFGLAKNLRGNIRL